MPLLKDIRKLRDGARAVKESIQQPAMPAAGDLTEWNKRDYWLSRGKEEAFAEVLRLLEGESGEGEGT